MDLRRAFYIPMLLLLLASCSREDDVYPSIITEFADMQADSTGVATTLTLDDGSVYGITNRLSRLEPGTRYRVVTGFTKEADRATIYSLTGAWLLRDSTSAPKADPTGILSAWRAGKYINLQLSPRTQDSRRQYWGFSTDSVTPHHAYLSLHHNQNGDPASYSTTVYASLPVDSIKGIDKGDTITLSINTFKGTREWTMKK